MNQIKRQEKIQDRISSIQQRLKEMQTLRVNLQDLEKKVDGMVVELEAKRCLTKVWLHIDMDGMTLLAFYWQTQLFTLQWRFVIILTLRENRLQLVVSQWSAPAPMKQGSSACAQQCLVCRLMSNTEKKGFICTQLCPELILIPPNSAKYKEASNITR